MNYYTKKEIIIFGYITITIENINFKFTGFIES